ncbi:GPP34 family phosphoprotein [Streptomyces niveus]|uniref:GPP34 family phosphoprotein n=1 Tax=Streptomyces niveus TaxID=193462 RepID=UPI0034222EDC
MPRTLPQRLYLLCYTVDKGKFQIDNLQGRGRLSAAGEVAVSRGKVMGVIPADRVTVAHPQEVTALQERLRNTVLKGYAPATIPLDELAMAVFAVELEPTSVWSRSELRTHKQAINAPATRFVELVPGLHEALRDSYLSSRAVGGAWSA